MEKWYLLNALKAYFILSMRREKISVEKVYYPCIINNIAYLCGAVVICDEDSMETFFIKMVDFGYDNEETETKAKKLGCVHITDSVLLDGNFDVVDKRYTKIKKK